jgi:hypothetical protein
MIREGNMKSLKLTLLMLALGVPLMGGNCGGGERETENCAVQTNRDACNAVATCKWRGGTKREIKESQKCDLDLPVMNPGEWDTPPPVIDVREDKAKCEAKGGIYVEFEWNWNPFALFGNKASCKPPSPCPIVQRDDMEAEENKKICVEKPYCKYIAAQWDLKNGQCVEKNDVSLDCVGKKDRKECEGVKVGSEQKQICMFNKTSDDIVEPARCTLREKFKKPDCPQVLSNIYYPTEKTKCETAHCFYKADAHGVHTCKKINCDASSFLASSKKANDINTYKKMCENDVFYCEYTPPSSIEVGECSDISLP